MEKTLSWKSLNEIVSKLEAMTPARKDGKMEIVSGQPITDKRVLSRLKKLGITYELK